MKKTTTPTPSDINFEPEPESANAKETSMQDVTAELSAVSTTGSESNSNIPPDAHAASQHTAGIDVLAKLRISQDFARKQGARKLDITVPLQTPKKGVFVRVHPTMEPLLVWTLVDEQQTFVVTSDMADSLPGVMVTKELVPAITRQGVLFLWPLRVPGDHGRIDNWLTSAKEAATHAVHAWVRVQANMALGAYEVYEAIGAIPDPEWPSLSMDEIVRIAVKGRVIDSPDHPVLQKLRGEI